MVSLSAGIIQTVTLYRVLMGDEGSNASWRSIGERQGPCTADLPFFASWRSILSVVGNF